MIQKIDERLSALDLEVRGAPLDVMLEEFEAAKQRRETRIAAIEEFHRVRREEFLAKLPELENSANQNREAYETFMRERGFEP